MSDQNSAFPKGFLWGAATSSHQIEGGLRNSWSEWENSPRRRADLKSRGLNPDDYQSGKASNSWEMLDEDIECLKKINASAYRFSIEWSRIEPEEGQFDEAAIARYADFIKKLQANNIEPFVTLWHWPLPLWLSTRGGWENRATIASFRRYADKLAHSLPEIKFWLTLNEPNIYTGNSYLKGVWPPQKKSVFAYVRVLKNLVRGHIAAYQAIKRIKPSAQVGVVTNNIYFDPAPGIINSFLAFGGRWWWNLRFLNRIKKYQDIIGVNFYFRNLIKGGFSKNPNEKVSDMGWELYPAGLEPVLEELRRYGKPIYITENGLADAADKYRSWYIREVLKAVRAAIEKEVDVRGYFYWSLLDNFEWAHGFEPKFGLFSVDSQSYERRPRPSALEYAKIAKDNSL